MSNDATIRGPTERVRSGAETDRLKVSVVIPFYSNRRYLEECLASVVRVADPDWEVLVVDDGSSEDIREIVDRFAPIVRDVRQANRGPAAARNEGLRQTSGEYVRFLDADDVLLSKDVVSQQIALLDRHPEVGMVFGSALRVDARGRPFGLCRPHFAKDSYVRSGDEEFRSLLFGNHVISMSTTVVRRSIVQRIGALREDLFGPDDWDLWFRVAHVSAIAYLSTPVAGYRIHEDSITAHYAPESWLRTHRAILERVYSDLDVAAQYGDLRRAAFARLDQRAANLAYAHSRPEVARRYAVHAFRSSLRALCWRDALGSLIVLMKTFLAAQLRQRLHEFRREMQRGLALRQTRAIGAGMSASFPDVLVEPGKK